jgi:cell division protein YceG involved in septum cleavage
MSFRALLIRSLYAFAIFCAALIIILLIALLQSKIRIFSNFSEHFIAKSEVEPFPVSVNIYTKTINENTNLENYYNNSLAKAPESKDNWWNKIAALFAKKEWYQNLASPVSRIVVVWPGERKEQVLKNFSDILDWDENQEKEFELLVDNSYPYIAEGKYFPSQYVAHKQASPEDVYKLMKDEFKTQVLSRYSEDVEEAVPLEDALVIASLLEREASDFENMREVSGVIWNRLFINMPLQLDATLQYAKANKTGETSKWPKIRPDDKYLKSPFNTYQNSGLPPAPISNPSTEAILAALNPVSTNCLFYFHTNDGGYNCSENYEEHVAKLRSIYGQGS